MTTNNEAQPRPAEPVELTAGIVNAARDAREREGLLTIDETAERYGIAREDVAGAVEAGRVSSATMHFNDGSDATFLFTADAHSIRWLAGAAA